VLLYWDEVGSIVPSPYAEDPARLSPYMGDLLRAGLVRPIVPEDYAYPLESAMEPFLAFVDADPEIARRARAGFGSGTASRGAAEPGTLVEIHRGKFGRGVVTGLVDRQLARPPDAGDERTEWLEVESRTAAAFMAHLAAALGSLPRVDMDPITDGLAPLVPFASAAGAAEDPLALAAELRMGVLESVLPGPAEGVPVPDLIRFKERHGELLRGFRRRIEGELIDLALVPDAGARDAKLRLVKEDLEEQVAEIGERMRPNWPALVFGTLCGLVGSSISAGAALASGAAPAAAAGAASLAGAVYSAYSVTRTTKDFGRDPLAYAALARERLTG
jgi:hypothetical protein